VLGCNQREKVNMGEPLIPLKEAYIFLCFLSQTLISNNLPLVTLATGLACRDVIHSTFNIQSQIKWPNDIYIGDKKLAGILCENIDFRAAEDTVATVVIGVGLNINNSIEDFPVEIQPIITTLFEHLKIQVDLHSLLSLIVAAIIKNVLLLSENRQTLLKQWQQYDCLYNKSVVYAAGSMTFQGTGLGISSQGYYRIRDTQGAEHCVVGGQLRLLSVAN
jgi:BirA family biotin operon repressor/biotin-[acetyl-CoA-carboxylase] ligase